MSGMLPLIFDYKFFLSFLKRKFISGGFRVFEIG